MFATGVPLASPNRGAARARPGLLIVASRMSLLFGGCCVSPCGWSVGTGAVLVAVPVVVLVLGERLPVVRDRGKVGKWLYRERGTLTSCHGERDGDRLVDVPDVRDAQPAHLLASVAHAGVAVDGEAATRPLRGVRAPCRREHPADALGRLERLVRELLEVDFHWLFSGALADLSDGDRLGAC